MSWREFWNGKTTIYVSDRHREIHYREIARHVVSLLPGNRPRVLDFGCGEALSAHLVAEACEQLVLCDGAPAVRETLKSRTRALQNTLVLPPEAIEALPPHSFDVVVAISVVQYLSRTEFERWLRIWRRTLTPSGRLVIGDIVPRNVGPVADAAALLRFARDHGFLLAATRGLVRTALSDYRRTRARVGLLQLEEGEVLALAREAGFHAVRLEENAGHNPARLTFLARPLPAEEVAGANSPALALRKPARKLEHLSAAE